MEVSGNVALNLREGAARHTIYYPNDTDHQFRQVQASGRFYDFRTLRYISAVARLRKPKVIYDVGTCFANHSLYFASVLGCHVECFEPNVRLLPYIRQTMAAAGGSYTLHNVALGEHEGLGSTDEVPDNLGSSKFVAATSNASLGQTRLASMDEYVASQKLPDPDFIKIDTEGFECKILRGARRLLDRASPELFVEISPENETEGKSLLHELGYQRVLFNYGKNYHYSKRTDLASRISLTASSLWIDAQASLIRNAVSVFGGRK